MANTYTTKQGDTWDMISLSTYGSELFTDRLIASNFEQRNTAIFSAGVVLNTPVLETTELNKSQLPPWRRNA